MMPVNSDYQIPEKLAGTFLEKLVRAKMREVAAARLRLPAESIERALDRAPDVRSFRDAILRRNPAIIAEIKKASPSAGLLREGFDALKIAAEYQASGAAAISVVTEARYFMGCLETLAVLRWNACLPLLRKDFIFDPYQILEARHAGADAVLLIAALLNDALLQNLRSRAEAYGMEAVVEVHDEIELQRALDSGATLIGVNNRDLRTLEVNLDTSLRLAGFVPRHVIAIAESGIRSAEEIRILSEAGYRGFLVGEHLLRAVSPGAALAQLMRHQGRNGGRRK